MPRKQRIEYPGAVYHVGLVDYIHLNPVRARICPLSELKDYALSSYPK